MEWPARDRGRDAEVSFFCWDINMGWYTSYRVDC
jgi:hypothetical protein